MLIFMKTEPETLAKPQSRRLLRAQRVPTSERVGLPDYEPVIGRRPILIRWSELLLGRVDALALDLGLKRTVVFHLLVREALDARDARDARRSETPDR
jgi:hypothetical protein